MNTLKNTSQTASIRGQSTPKGSDKISHYKWKIKNNPGEFAMISKQELYVDHSYQRDKINELRINAIASDWDWVMCGALSVSERDGKWWVMDGQHRKLAADKRSDITSLPCMVFDLDSQQKEAGAFVGLNSQKTAVSGVDRFKAVIVAGDQSAATLEALLRTTGHKVGVSSGGSKTVACVMCVWKCFKRDEKVFKELWPLIADISAGTAIVDCLVRGVFGCEMLARINGFSITKEPYRSKLIQSGGDVLAAEIRREIKIVGKGGERIETIAIAKWINRQRIGSKYKLEI